MLFRVGVAGEAERDEERSAREHFSRHGEWPEEKPKAERSWTLPEGIATPESEAEETRHGQEKPAA